MQNVDSTIDECRLVQRYREIEKEGRKNSIFFKVRSLELSQEIRKLAKVQWLQTSEK